MEDIQGELARMLDRDRIRACVITLARGEDRRDAAMITSAYWPDARVDYGVFEGDFTAYLDWVVPGADAITNTQHVLGQTHVELSGDSARAETHVISYHRVDYGGGDEHDTCIGGRYLDVMERRGGEWRIASRTMLYDWYQDWGASVNWADGLMGLPLSQEWFSGRAKGDWSEGFFVGN